MEVVIRMMVGLACFLASFSLVYLLVKNRKWKKSLSSFSNGKYLVFSFMVLLMVFLGYRVVLLAFPLGKIILSAYYVDIGLILGISLGICQKWFGQAVNETQE